MQVAEIFLLFLFFLKNKKSNHFDIILLIFLLVELISTYLNDLNMLPLLRNFVLILTLYLSTKYGLVTNSKLFIKASAKVLFMLTFLNTISAIICYPGALFSDGISPYFLLGGDNTSIRIYILAILFSYLYDKLKSNKLTIMTISSIINMFFFSLLRDIGTGKVCIIVAIVLLLIFEKFKIKPPKNVVKKSVLVNFTLFFIIVLEQKLEFFSYLIINVLHRNLSLTDRTTIWNITLSKISEHPFIGNGFVSGEKFESMLPSIIGVNAHNTYLMIIYIGGVVLLITFLYLFFISSKRFDKVKHPNVMKILPIILFTMMIRAQLEGADTSYLILLLYMIYNYELIEKNFAGGD